MLVEEMKNAIKEQLKNEKKSTTVYVCGCQLAELVGNDEHKAQLVLEDFANGRDVKGCEAKIKEWAKKHGGGCGGDMAAEIICEYFGIEKPCKKNPLESDEAAAPTQMPAPKAKVLSLAELL